MTFTDFTDEATGTQKVSNFFYLNSVLKQFKFFFFVLSYNIHLLIFKGRNNYKNCGLFERSFINDVNFLRDWLE